MDMNKLMEQAQQMQADMLKAQEDLANKTVEASAGGGAVVVTANGAGEVVKIVLGDDAFKSGDKEMLEDMILAAVSSAQSQASDLAAKEMQGMLPEGLGGLGF